MSGGADGNQWEDQKEDCGGEGIFKDLFLKELEVKNLILFLMLQIQ